MAALQPPRNTVTDGDLVFIAGVIGNTQTHTHTHKTRKYKAIDSFWTRAHTHTHKTQFVFVLGERRDTHARTGLTGCGEGARCPRSHSMRPVLRIKGLCHGKTNKARRTAGEACLCFPRSNQSWCLWPSAAAGTGVVHLGYLSRPVSASNLHAKTYTKHICLLLGSINGCHVVYPINRPVYLLEHNKLATNTDKDLKNYKYCDVMISLNALAGILQGSPLLRLPPPFF